MRRIAHVTDVYLPRLGGIETHVAALGDRQRAARDHVEVFTSTKDSGPPVGGRDVVHRGRAHGLRARLLDGRFDVVHVHVSVISPTAMSLAAAACAAGLPVAVTVHSMWPDSAALVRPAGAGLRLRRRPVAWSTVSAAAALPLRGILGPEVDVDLVPNAVDVDWWRTAPQTRWPVGDTQVVVTSLMRFARRKRPVALIRMMHEVAQRVGPGITMRLVVGGDGPQHARVARLVRSLDMQAWVDLPGRLDPTQSRALLHASNIYLAPADLESFGLAALEARSAGVPVVAKSASGVAEFVQDGRSGLLVHDDRGMVDAVARLVTDPVLRERIASHNATVTPRTDWPATLTALARLYGRAEAVSGRARHQRARVLL